MLEKKVNHITPLEFKENQDGFRSIDLNHSDFQIDPILVFTEFHMDRPIFPPHPHAGISVMTYMLPSSQGSFLNRDSLGDKSIIEPGGMHVTQAGKGVKHEEVPTIPFQDCNGFQIWINHKEKDRFLSPKSFHASKKEVPEFKNESTLIRIVQGEYSNLKSPIELVTKTKIFDIYLKENSKLELIADEMAFIYLMSGNIRIQNKNISAYSIINFFPEGEIISLESENENSHFMFLSGEPVKEEIVYGGPFVMTNIEQMKETKKRLQKGEMGLLL
jgi:hypothetical protein